MVTFGKYTLSSNVKEELMLVFLFVGEISTKGNRKTTARNGLYISKNQPDTDEKHRRKKKQVFFTPFE